MTDDTARIRDHAAELKAEQDRIALVRLGGTAYSNQRSHIRGIRLGAYPTTFARVAW
jgi:hypothetical protein